TPVPVVVLIVPPALASGAPWGHRLPSSLAPSSLAPQSRRSRAPPARCASRLACGAPLRHRLPSSLAPSSLAPQSRRRRAPPARCASRLACGAPLRHRLPSSLAPQSRRRRAPPARSSRQVLPGHVLVHADLGRQPEHPLGDDVAQDLRGPALDRVAAGPQVAVAGTPAVEVGALRPAHRPVVVTQPVGADQLHLELGNLLIQLREDQLG